MTDDARIIGSEKVTCVFGYWPTFHDAEVLWLHLDRRGSESGEGPTLEALVHGFEMTREVDPAGYFVLRHHLLVHFRFSGVTELKVDDLNQQNVLFELRISAVNDEQAEGSPLSVVFGSTWGVGATFRCDRAAVVSVEPCDESGNPIRPGPALAQ
jgi:hypothetical protein